MKLARKNRAGQRMTAEGSCVTMMMMTSGSGSGFPRMPAAARKRRAGKNWSQKSAKKPPGGRGRRLARRRLQG